VSQKRRRLASEKAARTPETPSVTPVAQAPPLPITTAELLQRLEAQDAHALAWLEQAATYRLVTPIALWGALLAAQWPDDYAEPPPPPAPHRCLSREATVEALSARYGPQEQEERPGAAGLRHPEDLSEADAIRLSRLLHRNRNGSDTAGPVDLAAKLQEGTRR
jgi:hypothetical protein